MNNTPFEDFILHITIILIAVDNLDEHLIEIQEAASLSAPVHLSFCYSPSNIISRERHRQAQGDNPMLPEQLISCRLDDVLQ